MLNVILIFFLSNVFHVGLRAIKRQTKTTTTKSPNQLTKKPEQTCENGVNTQNQQEKTIGQSVLPLCLERSQGRFSWKLC